ncbi:FAD/NAD(P)-binding protein [Herbidospora mongoliensis]|uniref:FAD/NAD(P)-binding protein n=1 Tax=Herbidospora mongoliensis TaxID=688067 RepID=UPI00082E398C|nr:FAD/NAD(P)-binding protein [Herbidospora mongoliensis]
MTPVIVVVGGGASGTLAAVHLLHAARVRRLPLHVVLIDRYARHGLGQAYSTTDPAHLLNAPAVKMSALEHDPADFVRWAKSPDCAFLPRQTYGHYLRDVLERAQDVPERTVRRVTGDVASVSRRPYRVSLTDGRVYDADAIVLATGNAAPGLKLPEKRCTNDPWAVGALNEVDSGDVLVVGTGLTMVDLAVTLTRTPDRTVYAVSRHGLLPRVHDENPVVPRQVTLPEGPLTLRVLFRAVHEAASHGEWRGVVDGLRPRVPELWSRLPLKEQRRFLQLAARYWEIHRHRIPPVTAAKIADLRSSGRLKMLNGCVDGVSPGPDGVIVHMGDRDIPVSWVLNATGPGSVCTRDPLLTRLIGDRMVRPDRLGLGIDADARGRLVDAAGHADDRLVTLGPVLRGSRYETTAIPEIRGQAATLAPHVIDEICGRLVR